ncbi:hypothetical protein ABZ297_35850 [Nonomuraea sp. NPDC005983]|uniref:hypothetical protein n=1 Tax=Nonomuraea sp. NPDC005983 TaxID=3155595 RepID=UPI0033BA30FB
MKGASPPGARPDSIRAGRGRHRRQQVRTAEALHVHGNTLVYRPAKVDGLRERAQPLSPACVAELLDERRIDSSPP